MDTGNQEAKEDEYKFGNDTNFWVYSNRDGFDLTRRNENSTCLSVRFQTTTYPVIIDAARSALIIIDMQNFFLHPSIRTHQTGLAACTQILQHALPAARKAKIQIIWLNWGLTEQDIALAPPGLQCAFGFDRIDQSTNEGEKKPEKLYKGFGTEMGEISLPTGERIDAGRLLMRQTWNAQLYDPLQQSYSESLHSDRPDQWFHKDRISGMWTDNSSILSYLHENRLTTLFFAGVNTDQCVSGTLHDASYKGFDCLLLRDGCGTTSPSFAQQTIEYNCARGSGFVIDCETFQRNIEALF